VTLLLPAETYLVLRTVGAMYEMAVSSVAGAAVGQWTEEFLATHVDELAEFAVETRERLAPAGGGIRGDGPEVDEALVSRNGRPNGLHRATASAVAGEGEGEGVDDDLAAFLEAVDDDCGIPW